MQEAEVWSCFSFLCLFSNSTVNDWNIIGLEDFHDHVFPIYRPQNNLYPAPWIGLLLDTVGRCTDILRINVGNTFNGLITPIST